jgi:L-ascorbate metabolism protein UlaG (beta-lactamase superfamily)
MLNTQGNKITWLGHATFRITTPSGQVIVIDPFLEANPMCPPALKKLPRVDIILLTHGHADHMSDLIPLAREHSPQVVAIYETAKWLEKKGIQNVHTMAKGGTVKVGEIEATMVDARHTNSIQDGDELINGGEAAAFVVRLPGGFTLYHAGDTCVFGDMKLIGEIYAPDVACLPIGDHYTMGPREAAYAIRLLGVKHVVPMHYGTFPVLTGTPEALREAAHIVGAEGQAGGLEIHALKPGESLG